MPKTSTHACSTQRQALVQHVHAHVVVAHHRVRQSDQPGRPARCQEISSSITEPGRRRSGLPPTRMTPITASQSQESEIPNASRKPSRTSTEAVSRKHGMVGIFSASGMGVPCSGADGFRSGDVWQLGLPRSERAPRLRPYASRPGGRTRLHAAAPTRISAIFTLVTGAEAITHRPDRPADRRADPRRVIFLEGLLALVDAFEVGVVRRFFPSTSWSPPSASAGHRAGSGRPARPSPETPCQHRRSCTRLRQATGGRGAGGLDPAPSAGRWPCSTHPC